MVIVVVVVVVVVLLLLHVVVIVIIVVLLRLLLRLSSLWDVVDMIPHDGCSQPLMVKDPGPLQGPIHGDVTAIFVHGRIINEPPDDDVVHCDLYNVSCIGEGRNMKPEATGWWTWETIRHWAISDHPGTRKGTHRRDRFVLVC